MSTSLKVTWTEALSTGNKATDVQHKYLVDIINELADAIETGQTAQSVKKILNLLQYYTEWHFQREEMCMDRFRCPAAAANKEAHGQFIQTFLKFRDEFYAGGGAEDIALRMYHALVAWLVAHIQKVDAQLAPCVHSLEQAAGPAPA
jgi:hemerythrin